MTKKGIVVSQVHARNDRHSFFKGGKVVNSLDILNNLDILENQIISIPVSWFVTKENREYIIQCIREFSNSDNISKELKLLI